jgi:myo-inositol 2-dehydrogenase/D-chiro-inositol 1-dehydrogenase
MKFALLGCDPDTLDLALAVARSDEHELSWAHDLGPHEPAVRSASPGLLLAEHWEDLLGGSAADVVIVSRAGDQELRTEQLRKLTQAGITMVVSHPVVDSMLVYYEVDMIRQESRAAMLAYLPELWRPAWKRVSGLVADGAAGGIGALEQIVVEHPSANRGRSEVLYAFVRDMELVRPFCGALNKVSAMTAAGVRTSPEQVNYGTLSVQMSSLSQVLVRWSISTAAEAGATRYVFLGAHGRVVLDTKPTGAWQFELHRDGDILRESIGCADAAAVALPALVRRIRPAASPGIENDDAGSAPLPPDWLDACRTMELADAAEHSLQRGRTIELHYDTPSEQATFKGVMSGVGCLLLMVGLLVLVVATTAVHAGVPLANYWPYLLLGVLVVFLLLQCLRLVFPGDRPPL